VFSSGLSYMGIVVLLVVRVASCMYHGTTKGLTFENGSSVVGAVRCVCFWILDTFTVLRASGYTTVLTVAPSQAAPMVSLLLV